MNNSRRFFKTAGLFLFLFFLPTQLGKHFFPTFAYLNGVKIDYLAPTIYLTDLLAVILIAFSGKRLLRNIHKNLFLWLSVILVFITQSLTAPRPLLAFYFLLKLLELVCVYQVAKEMKNERLVMGAFLLGGLLQLFLAVGQLMANTSLQGVFYFLGERYLTTAHPEIAQASLLGKQFLRPYGTFSHPNSLAGFYLLLYFYTLINKRLSQFLITKTLSLFVFSLLVFISFSKSAIMVYLFLTIIYVAYHGRKCRLCLLARLAITAVVAFIFLMAQTDPQSLDKRLTLFRDGWLIFQNHWLWGTGLGQYLIYQANLPSRYWYFFLQPAHNIFFLFFTQTGVIIGGLIIFLLFQNFKKEGKRSVFWFCFLVVLMTGMADHYWLTLQQNLLLLGVVFGLLHQSS